MLKRFSPTFLLILLGTLLFVPWSGPKPFFSRGEAREALVAQQMFETGNYVLPTGYSGAVPSKPPFIHWFSSALSLPFGEVTAWTARLPSAILGIAFLVFFFRTVRARTGDESLAITASMILLFSFEWFRGSSEMRVDIALAVCLASALLLLYRSQSCPFSSFCKIALLLIGATLAKGPIGFCLPLAIWGFYQLLVRRLTIKECGYLSLLALTAAAGAGIWYYLAWQQRGDEFLAKVFYENFARVTSTMDDEPHKHSALYLAGVLFLGFLPGSLVVASLCHRFLRRGSIPKASFSEIRSNLFRLNDSFVLFNFVVAVSIFVFFAIPSSKRSAYLLPAYPALAFLTAWYLHRYLHDSVLRYRGRAVALLTVLYLTGQLASIHLARKFTYRSFAEEIEPLVQHDAKLYSFGNEFYGLPFYLKKPFFTISDEMRPQEDMFRVVLFDRDEEELRRLFGAQYQFTTIHRSKQPMVKAKRYPALLEVRALP